MDAHEHADEFFVFISVCNLWVFAPVSCSLRSVIFGCCIDCEMYDFEWTYGQEAFARKRWKRGALETFALWVTNTPARCGCDLLLM